MLGSLRYGQVVHRRIVDRIDIEGHGLAVGLRRAAGIAVVVEGDRKDHAIGGILRGLEGHAVGGDEEVDIGQAAGQGQHASIGTTDGDAQPTAGAQRAAEYREGSSDGARTRIHIAEADTADHARHILGHGDRRRRGNHGRIVHCSDLQGQAGGGVRNAQRVDVDGQLHITAGVDRRSEDQAIVGDEQVDIGQGAAQGERSRGPPHGHTTGAGRAEGTAGDREGHDTQCGVDIAEADLAERGGCVLDDRQGGYSSDDWRIVDGGDGDVTGHGSRRKITAISHDELHRAGGGVRVVRGVVVAHRTQGGLELLHGRLVARGSKRQGASAHIPHADDIAHRHTVIEEAEGVLSAVVSQQAGGSPKRIGAVRIGQGQGRVHRDWA